MEKKDEPNRLIPLDLYLILVAMIEFPSSMSNFIAVALIVFRKMD